MTTRSKSAVFRHIEDLQGARPWGALLDAGTGVKSIRWVSGLETERWTAVTGASGDAQRVSDEVQEAKRPQDQILVGNWADGRLLKGDGYDTVLADYLLGAVEGFAPFFQPYLFARLRPLTRGVLYMIGVEPYVPADHPTSTADRLVWEIGRYRDACLLLTGGLPYREYPSRWVVDQLQRAAFKVGDVKRFPIRYKAHFVKTQIDLCRPGLERLADRTLADALIARGEALRADAIDVIKTEGALRSGYDYVVAAEPV
ncbi:MAG: class I SAM-dependent methyltransferase [Pseudomonadota bacterium]